MGSRNFPMTQPEQFLLEITQILFSEDGSVLNLSAQSRRLSLHKQNIVKVIVRPMVSRPVSSRHLGPANNFLFPSLEIIFSQFRVIYYDAPSLTRRWVCNVLVQLLLCFASAVSHGPVGSRSSSPYSYLSITGWPLYTPGHDFPFSSPLTIRRDTLEVFCRRVYPLGFYRNVLTHYI